MVELKREMVDEAGLGSLSSYLSQNEQGGNEDAGLPETVGVKNRKGQGKTKSKDSPWR